MIFFGPDLWQEGESHWGTHQGAIGLPGHSLSCPKMLGIQLEGWYRRLGTGDAVEGHQEGWALTFGAVQRGEEDMRGP